jgi:hypothetical protein
LEQEHLVQLEVQEVLEEVVEMDQVEQVILHQLVLHKEIQVDQILVEVRVEGQLEEVVDQ